MFQEDYVRVDVESLDELDAAVGDYHDAGIVEAHPGQNVGIARVVNKLMLAQVPALGHIIQHLLVNCFSAGIEQLDLVFFIFCLNDGNKRAPGRIFVDHVASGEIFIACYF